MPAWACDRVALVRNSSDSVSAGSALLNLFIAHYRDVLRAAIDAGIDPWVCLHHFTLPRWFAADGGFLRKAKDALTP